MGNKKNNLLPKIFKPLLWSYRFEEINPKDSKKTIIVNSINYGDLPHWKWLFRHYGKSNLRHTIQNIPFSEFRPGAIKLMGLMLNLTKLKYASRSNYTKGEASPVRLDQI
jgi:hypothetical protein